MQKNNKKTLLKVSILTLILSACANIKLVSNENKQLKFCTNPNNQIAKESDFDQAASKQCGAKYKFINGGLEFFTDPNTPKIAGILEVQKERRMCRIYQCTQ